MRCLTKDGFSTYLYFHCFITTVVVLRLCRIMGNNQKRKTNQQNSHEIHGLK